MASQVTALESSTGRHQQEKDSLKRVIETLRSEKESMESKVFTSIILHSEINIFEDSLWAKGQSKNPREHIESLWPLSKCPRVRNSCSGCYELLWIQDCVATVSSHYLLLNGLFNNCRSVPPSTKKSAAVPVSLEKELKSREQQDVNGSLSTALGQQINVRSFFSSCLF